MMRAVVVLPTPRTPVSMYACAMRPDANALRSVRTMASWPIRSSKLCGRYLRASTTYGLVTPPSVSAVFTLSGFFFAMAFGRSADSSAQRAGEQGDPRRAARPRSAPDCLGDPIGARERDKEEADERPAS